LAKKLNMSLKKMPSIYPGYTCFNDVTERFYQGQDGQWTRGKGFDTFAPCGPWIETQLKAGDLQLETILNGKVRQSARTSELIFGIPQIISFISGVMTLFPGDVIAYRNSRRIEKCRLAMWWKSGSKHRYS